MLPKSILTKRSLALSFFMLLTSLFMIHSSALAANCPDSNGGLTCAPGTYSWGPEAGTRGTFCYQCDADGTWTNLPSDNNCQSNPNPCIPNALPTPTPDNGPTPTPIPNFVMNDDQTMFEQNVLPGAPPSLDSTTYNIVYKIAQSGVLLLGGCYSEACQNQGQANNGAIAALSRGIGVLYENPPASSVEYIADVGQRLGLIAKPAYADGVGFTGLNPILPLWRAFRNISYALLTLILVVIGFMIMLRVKIDPKTVVSIEAALPRLFVVLLLITFSYAIAGLLIDLMYVVIALALGVFQQAGLIPGKTIQQFINSFQTHNAPFFVWITFGGRLFTTPAAAVGAIINQMINQIPVLGAIPLVGRFIGFLGSIVAALVILIAVVVAMIKLWFTLIMAYITIILEVILGPIMILPTAIPGQNSFKNWLKDLIANLGAFVVTAIMFMLAWALIGSNQAGISGTKMGQVGWAPPFLGFGTAAGANAIPALIGLGMVLLTPQIVTATKKLLGSEGILGGKADTGLESILNTTVLTKQRREVIDKNITGAGTEIAKRGRTAAGAGARRIGGAIASRV